MREKLPDIDYPNKKLVLYGPDGGFSGTKMGSRTHYDQIFNKLVEDKQGVSGAFTPVLNYSQFLTRHVPHPFRVRHMKGLLDNPICNVNDEVPEVQTTSRYQRSISTPERAKNYFNGRSGINEMDITLRLKKPKDVMMSQSERNLKINKTLSERCQWQKELTRLTQKTLAKTEKETERQNVHSQYFPHKGRLNETPVQTKKGSRAASGNVQIEPITMENKAPMGTTTIDSQREFGMDSEALVMDLLGQMLGTNSVTAIQTWLCNANDKEKSQVAEAVRNVVDKEISRRESQR